MKYLVTVCLYGGVEIEAPDPDVAVQIAGESVRDDEVSWDEEMHVISAEPLGE